MPIGYYLRRYVSWCSCTTLPISETDSELSFGDPVLLLRDWCVINLSAECSPVVDVHGSAKVHSLDDHRSDTTSNPEIILTGTDASVEYLYAKPLNQTSNLRKRTLEDSSFSRSRQHRSEPGQGVNEMGSRTRSRKNATTFKPLEEEFLSREQIYRLYGVRGDDVSLAEQGMTRGSTGSLEYHDDPEEIREERGDEAYLVTAEEPEPVPEDVLNYQESAPTIGQLEVIFDYNGDGNRMNVTIIKGLGLPTKENGGASAWRLRIMLYPKKQRTKTRIRESEEPIFKELFRFTRIRPHELVNSAIRFRLYGAERMRKERLIGEGLVKFSSLNTSSKESVIVNLVSRSEAVGGGTASPYSSNSDLSASGESNASLQSLAHGGLPELLVGLTYNATTGRLAVELIKGSHFKQHAAGRAPDSYVRIALMSSSGFEMTKSKTSVRRGQPNPTFKETFIFQVAQFQLADVTLMFSVFNKRGMKRKETIGWFTMGLSNSSDEETAHWKEMRESKGHQVCRWHAMSDK
ncbi:synaptotagmin-16-like isoform X1 [Asterias amurensis]|uniref:synaptotagmin-16-like isoform X1 n=1 Tax=Asterias amurensis TaxID=7602 RepID=UPI003AB39612